MSLTIEQIKALDKVSDPLKLLPTTITFLQSMRDEVNTGRSRRGEPLIPWTADDERRY